MKLKSFLACCILFLSACADESGVNMNENNVSFPEINVSSKTELLGGSENGMSLSKRKPHGSMTELARFFAADKKWLKKAGLNSTKRYGVAIDQLADEAANSQMKLDGIDYTLKIELLNSKQADALDQSDKDFGYGVALDPDMFYPGESEIPAYYWNRDSRQVEETSISIVPPSDDEERGDAMKQAKDAISFPVFVVTVEQTGDDSESDREFRALIRERLQGYYTQFGIDPLQICEDCGGGGGGTPPPPPPTRTSGVYFVIHALNLHDKKDDSNDEFEFYIDLDGFPNIYGTGNNYVQKNTIHKFNANTRNDASNYPVYYRDVNGDQGWENMSQDIAIMTTCHPQLLGCNGSNYVAIEDDDDAGKHDYGQIGGETPPYPHRIKDIQYFDANDATVKTSTWRFDVDWSNFQLDADDVYTQSGIANVDGHRMRNLVGPSWNSSYLNIIGVLPDIDYIVGVRMY